MAAFEIGSLVCALAPNSHALIVGRAVTGLGASGILGGSLILLTVVIPLHKRAVYTGTLQSMFAVASIVGPLIGGALTQNVTWRWCFYVNLPIGGFSAAVIQVFCNIKRSPTGNMSSAQKIRSLDGLGFVLFAGAIIMLLLGLQWGGTAFAWSSSVIVGLFIGAGVTFLVFAGWQVYMGDSALVPSNLFTHRNVVLILCAGFLSNGPFQILVYWLPIWFQAVLGVTPTASGVRYLPTVISDVLAAFVGGGLAMKLGMWNPLLLFGNAAIALGAGLLSTIYPGVPDGHWIGFQIFIGVGYSLVTTMVSFLLPDETLKARSLTQSPNKAHLGMQATLPVALVPVGTSTLLAVISSGCAVFLAVGQAVFQMRLVENLSAVVSANMVNAVLGIGATEIRSIVDQADLAAVVNAYGKAVTEVFVSFLTIWLSLLANRCKYIPAAAPVLAFLCVCFTAWISVKKSEGKDLESKNGQSTIEKV